MYFLWWFQLQLILMGIFNVGDAIIGGKPAKPGQFPYMAYIVILGGHLSCGGGILDETHIITAAHCVDFVDTQYLTVIVGETQIDLKKNRRWEVERKIIHPDYRPHKCVSIWRAINPFMPDPREDMMMQNDIAVLKLKEPLPIGPNIKKLEFIELDVLPYDDKCKYAGWGDTDTDGQWSTHLQWTELEILAPKTCKKFGAWHRNEEFCAMDPEKKSVSAPGDSGNPLVCHRLLFGVDSTGPPDPSKPTIMTRIPSHAEFIVDALTQ